MITIVRNYEITVEPCVFWNDIIKPILFPYCLILITPWKHFQTRFRISWIIVNNDRKPTNICIVF